MLAPSTLHRFGSPIPRWESASSPARLDMSIGSSIPPFPPQVSETRQKVDAVFQAAKSTFHQGLDWWDNNSRGFAFSIRFLRWGGNGLQLFVPALRKYDVLGFLRVPYLLDIPSNLRTIYRKVEKFVSKNDTLVVMQRVMRTLDIGMEVGNVADNAVTGVYGLKAIGLIAIHHMIIPEIFMIFATVLEALCFIRDAIITYRTMKAYNDLVNNVSLKRGGRLHLSTHQTMADHQMRGFIERLQTGYQAEKSTLRQLFREKGRVFNHKLEQIKSNILKGDVTAREVKWLFRAFFEDKLVQHGVKLAINAIMFTGAGLMIGGFGPLGFGLMFLALVFNKLAQKYIDSYQSQFQAKCDALTIVK